MILKNKFSIEIHKLSNGLTLALIPQVHKNNVSLNLAYKVGSKNEISGKTGMAHLFEHLMFEGSQNLKKGEFDKFCTMAGGVNNAYTSYDLTAYTMTVPSNQLELAFYLESDRMLEFSVTGDSLATQQKVVSEEIRQTVFDQPYGVWREYLASSAYEPDSCYSWEVHGKIEDVESVDLEYLKYFFDKFYQPDNSVLAVCGAFDRNFVIDMAEKFFGRIKRKIQPVNSLNFSDSMLRKKVDVTFEDTVALPAVFLNYHFPGFLYDEFYIADVISNLSSAGRSARMYHELIHKKQIASSVGSFVDKREGSSLLSFYAIAQDENTDIEHLYDELRLIIYSFACNQLIDNELSKTINQLRTIIAYDIQYSSGLADVVSTNLLFSSDLDRIYNVLEKYGKIRNDDIIAFGKKYLNRDNEIRITCLPQKK